MCSYYYLHHHHISPCTRPIDVVVHYVFCQDATTTVSTTSPSSGTPQAGQGQSQSSSSRSRRQAQQQQPQQQQQQRQPCQNLFYDHSQSIDYADPCATGGCLISPDCTSGACRLQELGGRWTCCSCRRGGNKYRWCRHRMRKSPDTFCYHSICESCTADVGGSGGRGSGGVTS